jgi:hypothetical protein
MGGAEGAPPGSTPRLEVPSPAEQSADQRGEGGTGSLSDASTFVAAPRDSRLPAAGKDEDDFFNDQGPAGLQSPIHKEANPDGFIRRSRCTPPLVRTLRRSLLRLRKV